MRCGGTGFYAVRLVGSIDALLLAALRRQVRKRPEKKRRRGAGDG